ncbi:MAG: hypothetical protein IPL61_21375 [Myxococcales bacterium]|nr:hypothetical protein [Myxococcales bacterium]
MSTLRRPRTPIQLTLDQARRPTGHGGWRPGAGRKKRKGSCAHLPRVRFPASVPVHVTLKVVGGLPSFRRPPADLTADARRDGRRRT